jgi:hypothetical protein
MTTNTINNNSRLDSLNSEKLSFRLPRWQKDIVDFVSKKESLNQTDVIRNSINNYFLQASTESKGELKQKTKERYVQMDLFEWAEKNQTSTPSTERDPFMDFYYGKQ